MLTKTIQWQNLTPKDRRAVSTTSFLIYTKNLIIHMWKTWCPMILCETKSFPKKINKGIWNIFPLVQYWLEIATMHYYVYWLWMYVARTFEWYLSVCFYNGIFKTSLSQWYIYSRSSYDSCCTTEHIDNCYI